MAQQRQDRRGEVQAATASATGLACFIFRFLRRPREVGFGAANMFYDPADRDDLCLDPRRIAQMADAFSRALDVDPRRLLDQAYAYGCLSAAWNADGEEEQRDLAIAAAIKQVRQTSY